MKKPTRESTTPAPTEYPPPFCSVDAYEVVSRAEKPGDVSIHLHFVRLMRMRANNEFYKIVRIAHPRKADISAVIGIKLRMAGRRMGGLSWWPASCSPG